MKSLKMLLLVLIVPVVLFLAACGPTSTGGENEWKWVVQSSADASSEVSLQNPWENMETEAVHGNSRGSVGLVKVGSEANMYGINTLKLDVNLSDFDTEATQNDKIGFEIENEHSVQSDPDLYLYLWNDDYPETTKIAQFQGGKGQYGLKFFDRYDFVAEDVMVVDVTKDITITFSYMSTDGTIKDMEVNIEAAKITGK